MSSLSDLLYVVFFTIIIMPLLAPQLLAFWLLYPSCFDVNLNCVVIGLELCVKEQLVAA